MNKRHCCTKNNAIATATSTFTASNYADNATVTVNATVVAVAMLLLLLLLLLSAAVVAAAAADIDDTLLLLLLLLSHLRHATNFREAKP